MDTILIYSNTKLVNKFIGSSNRYQTKLTSFYVSELK